MPCKWRCIGENTGPNPVEWCEKCGKIRDGEEITYPEVYEMEGCPEDYTHANKS
jgi:hypothetical protein